MLTNSLSRKADDSGQEDKFFRGMLDFMLCSTSKTSNVFSGSFPLQGELATLVMKRNCFNFILKGKVGNSSKT
jgi:hypothetical protein